MRLAAATGVYVDLQIVGYQFPGIGPDSDDWDEWDANWLLIRGVARTPDGVSWSFEDPALTTWEVKEAAGWLRRAVEGVVAAASAIEHRRAGGDQQDRLAAAGWLTSTEPNLSFAVGGRHGELVEVRVGLGHECAPPPVHPRRPRRYEISLLVDPLQLREAATSLERQLAAFPAR